MRKPSTSAKRPAQADIGNLLVNGLAQQQAGRDSAAEALYAQVLAIDPNQAGANHLLGLIRLKQGRATEAVELISRSVRSKPSDPQYLSNFGVALRDAGRPLEAIEVLYRAVALKPDMAEAYANLGNALRAARRHDDAVTAHRSALRIRPDDAGFHFSLGNALIEAGFPLESRQSFRRALDLNPAHTGAANALAIVLDRHGASGEALGVVEKALAVSPGNAQLLMRRGCCLQHLGRLAEAEQSYHQSRDLDHGLGETQLHLAYLTRNHAPTDVVAMERLVRNERAPIDQRVLAGFGLGKALRDEGRHADSIAAFKLANLLHRQRNPYSVDVALAQVCDETRWADDIEPVHERVAPGAARHIFVVGLPRSGKTTIESILARHPDVTAGGELPIMMQLVKKLRAEQSGSIGSAALAALGADYRHALGALLPSAAITVDTMPSNYRWAGLIRLALPDARIIWCSRPLPELSVAIFEKHFANGHDYSRDLNDLRRYAGEHEARRNAWLAGQPEGGMTVDVGGFARDSDRFTRTLLDHCGLAWHPACATPVTSEPQLAEWPVEQQQANTADHLAAWRALHPELWARVEAVGDPA